MALAKVLTLTALMYATYLTVKCPCETLLCCSKTKYIIAMGVATSIPLGLMFF